MSYISGIMCDTESCRNKMLYTAHAPGVKETKGSYLPGRSHLNRWAREKGWSIGTRILCPTCRKLYGKPKTLRQIQRENRGKTVYRIEDFIHYRDNFNKLKDIDSDVKQLEHGVGWFNDGITDNDDIFINQDTPIAEIVRLKNDYKYVIWCAK